MSKKFTEGLIFGAGFGISFIAISYIAAYLIYPMFMGGQLKSGKTPSSVSEIQTPALKNAQISTNDGIPFHQLKLEEQIEKSSVIAIAKYEPSSDGKMKAIIKEFLKKEPGVIIYYQIGDEYQASSYYPKENTNYGDGIVMFFTGSPATMRMSMTYSGNRIHSLGDIPLELFKKKCRK